MTGLTKYAALAMAVVLLAQPLAAATACWQQDMARASCPRPCSMPNDQSPTNPLMSADERPCCQVTSSKPAQQATAAKAETPSRQLTIAPEPAVALMAREALAPTLFGYPAFQSTTPSLQALHCVLLI